MSLYKDKNLPRVQGMVLDGVTLLYWEHIFGGNRVFLVLAAE